MTDGRAVRISLCYKVDGRRLYTDTVENCATCFESPQFNIKQMVLIKSSCFPTVRDVMNSFMERINHKFKSDSCNTGWESDQPELTYTVLDCDLLLEGCYVHPSESSQIFRENEHVDVLTRHVLRDHNDEIASRYIQTINVNVINRVQQDCAGDANNDIGKNDSRINGRNGAKKAFDRVQKTSPKKRASQDVSALGEPQGSDKEEEGSDPKKVKLDGEEITSAHNGECKTWPVRLPGEQSYDGEGRTETKIQKRKKKKKESKSRTESAVEPDVREGESHEANSSGVQENGGTDKATDRKDLANTNLIKSETAIKDSESNKSLLKTLTSKIDSDSRICDVKSDSLSAADSQGQGHNGPSDLLDLIQSKIKELSEQANSAPSTEGRTASLNVDIESATAAKAVSNIKPGLPARRFRRFASMSDTLRYLAEQQQSSNISPGQTNSSHNDDQTTSVEDNNPAKFSAKPYERLPSKHSSSDVPKHSIPVVTQPNGCVGISTERAPPISQTETHKDTDNAEESSNSSMPHPSQTEPVGKRRRRRKNRSASKQRENSNTTAPSPTVLSKPKGDYKLNLPPHLQPLPNNRFVFEDDNEQVEKEQITNSENSLVPQDSLRKDEAEVAQAVNERHKKSEDATQIRPSTKVEKVSTSHNSLHSPLGQNNYEPISSIMSTNGDINGSLHHGCSYSETKKHSPRISLSKSNFSQGASPNAVPNLSGSHLINLSKVIIESPKAHRVGYVKSEENKSFVSPDSMFDSLLEDNNKKRSWEKKTTGSVKALVEAGECKPLTYVAAGSQRREKKNAEQLKVALKSKEIVQGSSDLDATSKSYTAKDARKLTPSTREVGESRARPGLMKRQTKSSHTTAEHLGLDEASLSFCEDLKWIPKAGNIIAYKVLELSDNFTPEISSFKVAKVIDVNTEANQPVLHLYDMRRERLSGQLDEYMNRTGDDGAPYWQDFDVTIHLSELRDAKIISKYTHDD